RYKSNDQEVFLSHSVTKSINMYDDTALLIDWEVRRIIGEGEASAREIITTYNEKSEAVALARLEYKTLAGNQLTDLMDGNQPVRPDDNGPAAPKASGVPTAGKVDKKRPDSPPEPGMEPQPES